MQSHCRDAPDDGSLSCKYFWNDAMDEKEEQWERMKDRGYVRK